MRLKIVRQLTILGLLVSGFALLGVGLFAPQLGIDHNSTWGSGRIRLVSLAAVLLAGGLALQAAGPVENYGRVALRWLYRRRVYQAVQKAWARAAGSRIARMARSGLEGLRASRTAAWLGASHPWSAALSGGAAVVVVVFLFLWYITGGTLAHWTEYHAYFDRLANAFHAGQLSLLEAPPAALVALANPYDYKNRAGVPFLWDASLYQGKYYYYWGPVPALILAGFKALAPVTVEDQYLVFFFCGGLVVALALLLGYLRERYFPGAPPWTLFPLVLFSGLAMPVFWLVNHPNVYETAISGELFFLILGLYAAFRGVGGRAAGGGPAAGWLCLTGFAWGAAVNCRLSIAPAVIFLAALFGWRIWRFRGPRLVAVTALAGLGLPMLLWAAGLGWYNMARFGSPWETGHRYQLTGMALPADYAQVTSLAYILPNAYNYFFRLPAFLHGRLSGIFIPFVEEASWPFFIHLPANYYYSDQVASLLAVVPGIWLAFLPGLGWMRRAWWWVLEKQPGGAQAGHPPAWLWWALAGGAACAMAPLLVFITSSTRYLADATPLLTCLAAVGFWWGLWFLRERSRLRGALLLLGCALMLASALASLVVVFNSGDMRFEAIQPETYARFAALLRGRR